MNDEFAAEQHGNAARLREIINKRMARKCKSCGGDARKIGRQISVSGKYQRYQCKKCGHTFKGELVEAFKRE